MQGRVHIWDSGNIIADIGTETVYYIRVLTLIYAKKGETKTYYRFNGHGDVIALANSSGAIIKRYKYDAFGVEENPGIFDTNVFRYCGEYYDVETKTIYLRARYYDAETGRFTQQDGWSYAVPGFLLSLNLYTYCWNNPVMNIDPSGRVPKKPINKKTSAERVAEDVATEINILEKMGKTSSAPKKPLENKKTTKDIIDDYIDSGEYRKDALINGQAVDSRVKDTQLGTRKMGYNGCEAVAIYNACVLTDNPVSLSEVVDWCRANALWMRGEWGCRFDELKNFWDGNENYIIDTRADGGQSFSTFVLDFYLFNDRLENSDVVILSFFNDEKIKKGIHTVAVQKCENGILVYNYYDDSTSAHRFDSLDDLLSRQGMPLSCIGISRR